MNDKACDIVIVGCGMAGITAGLRASELGKEVAILEKAPEKRRGGHTQFAESMRITTDNVDVDADFNMDDYSPSDYYADIMKLTDFRADPDLTDTVTSEIGQTFEWFTEKGIEWEYQQPHPGYASGRVWLEGDELIAEVVELIEEEGGSIYYNAEARSINRDDDGNVTGVDARIDGVKTRFSANSVILAAGDYGSNKEKRTRYYGPGYGNMKVRGSRYNTGEAIDAAMDIGAKPDGEWGDAHMAIIDVESPDFEGGITRIDGYQYGIIVNHDGERFVDEGEDVRTHTYAKFGREIFEQDYHEAFIIVDSKTIDDVAHMGQTRPITADSIESLVKRLDIGNVDEAISTIEKFNEACDPGEYDPESLDGNNTEGITPPKSNWALPLDEPPFTGFPVTGGMTFGFGGIAITPEAEVLDTCDNIIPGLYAAGNVTGGLFYSNYPGGSGLTNAAVFGKIAAENAADE
ncbi:FAD-dependent tricarballylate dehydrogenase TcuA [Natrialbaceae archaeon A-chndr2]